MAVILVTLVGQGLTLPPLISRARASATTAAWAPDEAVARLEAAQAALDRLDELEASGEGIPEEAIERLREIYRARFARCVASISGREGRERRIEDPAQRLPRELRRELIATERADADDACATRAVSSPTSLRRIQRDLDLDEARATFVARSAPRSKLGDAREVARGAPRSRPWSARPTRSVPKSSTLNEASTVP